MATYRKMIKDRAGNNIIPVTNNFALLWANSTPTQNFATQTVSIQGLSNYDFVMVLFCNHTSQLIKTNCSMSRYADGGVNLSIGDNGNTMDRSATFSSSSVTFTDARLNANTDNSRCIPKAIYGIKIY